MSFKNYESAKGKVATERWLKHKIFLKKAIQYKTLLNDISEIKIYIVQTPP